MPDDIMQRIGSQVRDHDARLNLHEERIKGLERLCDDEHNDDLRRRVERVESILAEHQSLMRESTLMISRLNETLTELKEEIKKMREIEKEVARMKVSITAVNWIAGTITTLAIGGVIAFLFKVQV